MSRRRQRGDNPDDILGDLGSNEAESPFESGTTASDFADAGYGTSIGHDDPFAKLGRNREKIHLTQIDAIIPNATQPRRAIPSSVRQYWSGLSDADSMANFFQRWLEEVNLERREADIKESFPLDALLAGEETPRTANIQNEDELEQINDKRTGAKEASLMRVVDLATTIKRDGLINPISIAQNGRLWEIETGERRWLAYQLLNWRISGDDWQKIPARQVDGVSIWRQSTENNTRADLNAIAKARQFALLLMDVRKEKEGDQFQVHTAFDHEQDYYAQVADGNQYRVPYGTGEKLINAMGISDVGQLRHLRRLLRLPQIVWTVADDLNWSENFIQKNILSTDDTETTRNGIRQALKDRYPGYLLEDYLHLLEADKSSKSSSKNDKFTYKTFSDGLSDKVYNFIQKMPKKDKQRAISHLEEMIESLKSD